MRVVTIAILVIALAHLTIASKTTTFPTPLQAWVQAPDNPPVFNWTLAGQFRNPQSTTYFVNLTSLRWLTPNDVTRNIWWHWVSITIPDQINYSGKAGIYVDGNSNTDATPIVADEIGVMVAEGLGVPMARLYMIPNQPLAFINGSVKSGHLSEDGLIAYTWLHFIQHPDQPEWLARFPMVKAVVKCMDMLQEMLPTVGSPEPTQFFIAGASKRGWTTWLVPAVDDRVIAIVPMVMPILNMVDNFNQMWRSQGNWSFALDDYVKYGIPNYIFAPVFQQLADIIDPVVYLPYLAKIPKYMIFATNDEFFLPDNPRNFFPLLKAQGGESHLRMMPGADHPLVPDDALAVYNIISFANLVLQGKPRPYIKETINYSNSTASIVVYPSSPPDLVTMYYADTYSNTRRDFRYVTCPKISCFQPVIWLSKQLKPNSNGSYTATMKAPEFGWTGFLIEVSWKSDVNIPGGIMYTVTSQVNIVPDIYPFPSPV